MTELESSKPNGSIGLFSSRMRAEIDVTRRKSGVVHGDVCMLGAIWRESILPRAHTTRWPLAQPTVLCLHLLRGHWLRGAGSPNTSSQKSQHPVKFLNSSLENERTRRAMVCGPTQHARGPRLPESPRRTAHTARQARDSALHGQRHGSLYNWSCSLSTRHSAVPSEPGSITPISRWEY